MDFALQNAGSTDIIEGVAHGRDYDSIKSSAIDIRRHAMALARSISISYGIEDKRIKKIRAAIITDYGFLTDGVKELLDNP